MANIEAIMLCNLIGLVLLIGLLISSRMARSRSTLEDRVFTCAILVCAGACVCEPLGWMVEGQPGTLARVVNMFCNTYCYLATNIYAYLWVLSVELRLNKTDRIKHWFPALLLPVVFLSILILGNVFGKYMFVLDENNVYARLPLGYANYVLTTCALLYSVHLRYKYQRELGSAHFFPILLFLAPVAVGASAQALYYGLSVGWPSVCVGLTLIYMSQQNEMSYVDSLTGLYNRTYLSYLFRRLRHERIQEGSGIMIDVDYFKEINDTYGHLAGDEALRHVAHIIEKGVPKGVVCIRFAGDEFVVLIHSSKRDDVVSVEEGIRARLKEYNQDESTPFELSLSMGYSIFDVEHDTAETFMQRMDAYMYQEKLRKHAVR